MSRLPYLNVIDTVIGAQDMLDLSFPQKTRVKSRKIAFPIDYTAKREHLQT
jgi:hypothetical protein